MKRMTSGTPSVCIRPTDVHVDLKLLRVSVCDNLGWNQRDVRSLCIATVAKCPSQPSKWKYLFGGEHPRTHRLSPVNESPIKIATPLAAACAHGGRQTTSGRKDQEEEEE